MTTKQRKYVSFDWAIKKILRNKENFTILEGFLSELLFDEIKIIDILALENYQRSTEDRDNHLDIKVKNSKDEIVVIEIQYNRKLDYLQQMLYSCANFIVENNKNAEPYAKITKFISINFLDFDLGIGDDYIYKGTTTFSGLHNYSQLKLDAIQAKIYKAETIEEAYPEYYLIRANKFNDIVKDSLDEWMYFFKHEEIKDNFKAKGLAKARQVLDYQNCLDMELQAFELYKESLHYQVSMYESTYVVGKMDGKIETLIMLLQSRFGELGSIQKEAIRALNEEKLSQMLTKIWTVQSLQDLL